MTLEPKSVDPGYLLRWTREACSLWAANFPLWFALMLVPCLLSVVLGKTMVTGIPLILLSFFTVYVSLEFATTAEHAPVRLAQVFPLLGAASKGMGDEIWRHRRVLVMVFGITFAMVAWLTLNKSAAVAEPEPVLNPGVLDWLFSINSPLLPAASMLFVGFQCLRYSGTLGYLTHPLCRMHGLSHEEARVLLENAGRKNVGATLVLELVVGFGAILCILLAPGLSPFLFCFFAAFCYVACRDMFGPGAPLHVAQAASDKLVAEGAAG